ncbi:MAG: HAD-IIA family hydrolase [Candidatus Promineifilaceae bacterium]
MALYEGYIFDLDGTIYLGDKLLPTAGETIGRLRQMGKRTVFLSNNPTKSRHDYARKLTMLGIETSPADIINSSAVMVHFLQQNTPDARLFVVGEASLREELRQAGFAITENAAEIDVVIASFDRTFTYHKLQVAFDALRDGARFFATNADKYCPVPGGGQPDAAAIIAAIEACTDVQCEAVVGKPSRYMAQAVLDVLQLPASQCLMTGDRLETDVLMGLTAGMSAALTLTGATRKADLETADIRPTYIINYLEELLTT